MIQFYSTQGKSAKASLEEAVMRGLAEDGGLFMPDHIPKLPESFFSKINTLSFAEIAFEVSKTLLQGALPEQDLKRIVENAISFDALLKLIHSDAYSLELFHGPTLSFKDFGARFMAQLMSYFAKRKGQTFNILVATSGDTGSAIAKAFLDVPGIRVWILYPKEKVSWSQEKQMRSEFKKIAENNTTVAYKLLEDFYGGGWKLAQTSSNLIDKCLGLYEVVNDVKMHNLLVMLRNCVSDICCCLDSLERGHDRTVLNNLRMVFEDFCCALHIHRDHSVYEKFSANKHSATESIGPAGKLRPNDTKFKWVYGELSKVSHHKAIEFLARQMVTREGPLSHLKPINPDRLHIQVYPLLMIVDFLRSIGEFAEEICLHLISVPYFWIKPSERNLGTKEDALIYSLTKKAEPIFRAAKLDVAKKPT